MDQLSLGLDAPPDGLRYVEDFVSPEEEQQLFRELAAVELQPVVMHGQAALRTVAHFGLGYDYDARHAGADAPPLPSWLAMLAARVAPELHARPDAVREVLVTHYPPGARIGWHKDAPVFGPAIGALSLAGPCTLHLRRARKGDGWERWQRDVAPRSLYVIGGAARTQWQHAIAKVPSLRWSITFRTLARR